MNELILPITFFFLGFIVWIFGLLFTKKQTFEIINIVCSIILGVSVLIFIQRGYYTLGGVFFCFAASVFVIYFSLEVSLKKEQEISSGPWKEYLGKEAVSLTCLEPKGKIQIDGKEIPATTEGIFLPQKTRVKIIRCVEKIVVVEKFGDE